MDELKDELETVPANLKEIDKKIDKIDEKLSKFSNKKEQSNIPKNKKAVIDLATYMRDAVTEFEAIASEYVDNIDELENIEKLKIQHQQEKENISQEKFEEGKRVGEKEIIKTIAEKFPSQFEEIKSLFDDFIIEKFEDELEITNENKNGLIIYFDNENIENGNYKIIKKPILLDNEILFKGKLERIEENTKEDKEIEKKEIKVEDVKEEQKVEEVENREDNNSNDEVTKENNE